MQRLIRIVTLFFPCHPPPTTKRHLAHERTDQLLQINTSNQYMSIVHRNPPVALAWVPDNIADNIAVVPSAEWPMEYGRPPPVFLMRDPSLPGPKQSYALESGWHPVDLEEPRYVPGWGQTFKAVVYPEVMPLTFEAPHPHHARFVDIDRLNLQVVLRYLDQTLGDGNPVLHNPYLPNPHLIERLQDENWLYLVKEPVV